MYDLLMRILRFLLPLFKQAALEVTADVAADLAYPSPRPLRRRRPMPYGRIPQQYTPYSVQRERDGLGRIRPEEGGRRWRDPKNGGYHDVIMVAFDIAGPSAELIREYLMEHMPTAGEFEFEGAKFDLDDWWIADDVVSLDDRDSAIFVPKGRQGEAREFLGRNFPTDPEN